MSTTEARKALPEHLSYEDCIHNISRASMLVNCFATGQFDPLRYAMEDRLHQPYRTHMFPYDPIIKIAVEAGAHGAYLSGAGPTVLAITGGIGRANVGDDTMSHFLAESTAEAMIRARPRTAAHRSAPPRTAAPAAHPPCTRPPSPPPPSLPPPALPPPLLPTSSSRPRQPLERPLGQARRASVASAAPRTSPRPRRWASSPRASPSRGCASGQSPSTARPSATRRSHCPSEVVPAASLPPDGLEKQPTSGTAAPTPGIICSSFFLRGGPRANAVP